MLQLFNLLLSQFKKRIDHYEPSAFFFGDPEGIRAPNPRLRRA